MSAIDDILFAPLSSTIPWRKLCRDIVKYIENDKVNTVKSIYDLNRTRPDGALLLERLMELFHVDGLRTFYLVVVRPSTTVVKEIKFNGNLVFERYEDGGYPHLGGFIGDRDRSIRDMNLVSNTYTRHYMFASEYEASVYMSSVPIMP